VVSSPSNHNYTYCSFTTHMLCLPVELRPRIYSLLWRSSQKNSPYPYR
jgi:hypothetical protein